MRITELSRPETRVSAADVLERAGYTQLGKGMSADVFHKEGANYVLKIFDTKDEAYLAFAKMAMAHTNIHLPKLFGKPIKVTPNYYALRMERLERYTGPSEWTDVLNTYIMRKRDRLTGSNTDWSFVYGKVAAEPVLQQACDLIAGIAASNRKFFCDLHPANVMMRGSTLVFTDPLATA